MRLGCLAVAGALWLIVFGGKEVRDAAMFRTPKTITCEQFTKSPPGEGWYKVTDAAILLTEASFMVHKSKYDTNNIDPDKIEAVYLPVHPMPKASAEFKPDAQVGLILRTKDPSILAKVKEMHALPDNEKQVEKWMDDHLTELLITRDITGMVESGLESDNDTRSQLAKLESSLMPNYAIMDEGKKPSIGIAGAKLTGGILLLFGSIVFWRAKASKPA
jgi:hypothetical protein